MCLFLGLGGLRIDTTVEGKKEREKKKHNVTCNTGFKLHLLYGTKPCIIDNWFGR